ncbi:hypothetical protein EXIGLDRAFT_831093 [Exidia glandulosa HHB12029]|uniref:RING-type domain-containing protein n=1 Tax=Exidia glandulosa HHB12029 TaxID=1314781 RepID=A0A166BCX6_EXIGL|nr:hypothetical protein EXIGLDRAFT_831093 [Exidia glandulosa HHB12029]
MPPQRFSIVCAICQEELAPGDGQSPPVVISCGHIFCEADLEQHKKRCLPRKPDCPLCRVRITHSTRLYPHIDESHGRRRVSVARAPPPSAIEELIDDIEEMTSKAKMADTLDDAMDVLLGAERTVLELDARKESKILRALKPLQEEVHRLRKELTAARKREHSELTALRTKNAKLEQQHEDTIYLAEKAVARKQELEGRMQELEDQFALLKQKYVALKRKKGSSEVQGLENEKIALLRKLRHLEKENRALRKPLPQVDDPSLEICDV